MSVYVLYVRLSIPWRGSFFYFTSSVFLIFRSPGHFLLLWLNEAFIITPFLFLCRRIHSDVNVAIATTRVWIEKCASFYVEFIHGKWTCKEALNGATYCLYAHLQKPARKRFTVFFRVHQGSSGPLTPASPMDERLFLGVARSQFLVLRDTRYK